MQKFVIQIENDMTTEWNDAILLDGSSPKIEYFEEGATVNKDIKFDDVSLSEFLRSKCALWLDPR